MKLKFLGTGSCFADDHNCAFFEKKDNSLHLIDCPELAFMLLKTKFDLQSYKDIYVYITHMHADHVSGLGELIHFAYYAFNKLITVVAPSFKLKSEIKTVLQIQGVCDYMYKMSCAFKISSCSEHKKLYPSKIFWIHSIPTKHSAILDGKCFGYQFYIDNTNVIYTGDSVTLEPFIPLLIPGTEFYMDTSVAYKSDAHIWLLDNLDILKGLVNKGVKVYLMHLDDAKLAKNFIKDIPGIEVVTSI